MAVSALGMLSCGGPSGKPLVIGATTSVHDSGLMDVVVPAFRAAHPGHQVSVVAVGTGEALALGRRRDVDLVLVHSPEAERAFVVEGYGRDRVELVRNDFVIAGPETDPAGIRAGGGALDALSGIAAAGARFVSRGDESGTHARELELWAKAAIEPGVSWYEEVGQGMGATLLIASERQAYLLTDRATLLQMGARLDLVELVDRDPALENRYSLIRVSGAVNEEGACLFSRWMRGEEAAALLDSFGRDQYGSPLFEPLVESALSETDEAARTVCGGSEPGS
jgi:tungstate transport system substrate-binding protein